MDIDSVSSVRLDIGLEDASFGESRLGRRRDVGTDTARVGAVSAAENRVLVAGDDLDGAGEAHGRCGLGADSEQLAVGHGELVAFGIGADGGIVVRRSQEGELVCGLVGPCEIAVGQVRTGGNLDALEEIGDAILLEERQDRG